MTHKEQKARDRSGRALALRGCFTLIFCFFCVINPVCAKDKIVIGGLAAPPYIIVDANRNVSGILVHLIRQSMADLDIDVEFKITNWARAFDSAKHGRIDALIPTIKSPDREKFLAYPAEPIAVLEMALLKNITRSFDFNGDVSALKPYHIGRIRNARVSPEFDDAANNQVFKLDERADFGLLAKAVAHNRLDLAAGDELMMLWAAASNGVIDQVDILHPHLANTPVYLALSKKSVFAGRVDEISDALKKVKDSQDYQQAVASYEKLLKPEVFEHLMKNSQD